MIKTSSTSRAPELRKKLKNWYRRHGRDLPWRQTNDAYAIAVSEIMLQQTTVAAVIPYYLRWMARFPTVADLAEATEGEVLTYWQGLGYYSRARNFLAAARVVCARHGGLFPADPSDLRALPGFGEYTTAAIQAFAWDRPVPVLDANISRVLARLGNIHAPIDKTIGQNAIRELARAFLPARTGGRVHNSALMDLGATLCLPRNPRCLECPVRSVCTAQDPASLPKKAPRKAITDISESRAFCLRRGKLALIQSPGPRWRGLWLLPEAENGPAMHTETYPITRYRVTMTVRKAEVIPAGATFFPVGELPALPSPHARAVAAMLAKRHSTQP